MWVTGICGYNTHCQPEDVVTDRWRGSLYSEEQEGSKIYPPSALNKVTRGFNESSIQIAFLCLNHVLFGTLLKTKVST